MSTEAQRTANQANAQLSTGPTSEEGKAISSQNRRKFGLTGRFTVLPWEKQEEFEDLRSRLCAEHQVYSPFEAELIEKMAQHHWLSRRAMLLQEGCFDRALPVCEQEKQLALYLRYQTTHDRAFERCATELRKLRKEREKAKIGFDSQKRREAEETRKQANENRRQAAESRKQELHQWAVLLAEAKVDHQQMLTSDVRFNQTLAQLEEEAHRTPDVRSARSEEAHRTSGVRCARSDEDRMKAEKAA